MKIPLQLTFHGLSHSDAIEARVRQRAAKLDRFFDRSMACRVAIEAPHQHRHKGNVYHVRVEVTVPGGEVVASRDPGRDHAHEDVHVAIRDAFDAIVRQLEQHAQRRRGDVKRHEEPPHARIVRVYQVEGYGFAETPDGLEVYFHENAVVDDAFWKLKRGDSVRLTLAEHPGEKGPQASTVQLVSGGP